MRPRVTITRLLRFTWVVVVFGIAAVSSAQEIIRLADERQVPAQGDTEFRFTLPEIAPGQQVRLGLDARIEWDSLGGSTGAMIIEINKTGLQGRHLINKPLMFSMRNDVELAWAEESGSGYRLMYSPDFSDRIKTEESYEYGIPDTDPYRFVWDISSYIQAGDNTITVNALQGMSFGLSLRNIVVEIGDPLPLLPQAATAVTPIGPPDLTAPLTDYLPKPQPKMPASIAVSTSGDIRFHLGQREFSVYTRTSLPEGQWHTTDQATKTWSNLRRYRTSTIHWETQGYSVDRQVTLHPDRITVKDTFRNTSSALVGVITEHRLRMPEEPSRTFLAGHVVKRLKQRSNPAHPTALAEFGDLAIGLVAEDDIFRLHAKTFVETGAIGLADPQLGIAPGQVHTLEWSIYAVSGGDYWDFINAIRRRWGVNDTLRGPSRWLHPGGVPGAVEPAQAWLGQTSMVVLCNPLFGTEEEREQGIMIQHGTALLQCLGWCDLAAHGVHLLKQAAPYAKTFIYTHQNLCTEPGHESKYPDSRAVGTDGTPATTVYSPSPSLFIPTLDNSYGKALMDVARLIVEQLDANLYIDEITFSNVPGFGAYDNTWDGCTVVIDPASHAVTGKLSSANLLMQPWRAVLMDYMKSRGKSVIANGPFVTRTMMKWGLQCFVESAVGDTAPIDAHLSHPLCLASYGSTDPRTQTEVVRRSLDQAGISFAAFAVEAPLFPITPLELRPGVIIGKERILTNRSGRFGWGDASSAEVYVLDDQGIRLQHPDVREVRQGDKVMIELRLPKDHLGVLVRK